MHKSGITERGQAPRWTRPRLVRAAMDSSSLGSEGDFTCAAPGVVGSAMSSRTCTCEGKGRERRRRVRQPLGRFEIGSTESRYAGVRGASATRQGHVTGGAGTQKLGQTYMLEASARRELCDA